MQFTVTLPTTFAIAGLHQPLVFCTIVTGACGTAAATSSEMSADSNIICSLEEVPSVRISSAWPRHYSGQQ